MRCDLHVRSVRCGIVNLRVPCRFGHECYSEPCEVFETARRRSLDQTLRHDSTAGATVSAAPSRERHLGPFGRHGRSGGGLQARRDDPGASCADLFAPVCLDHSTSRQQAGGMAAVAVGLAQLAEGEP